MHSSEGNTRIASLERRAKPVGGIPTWGYLVQVTLNRLSNLSEAIAFVLHWTVARVIVSCRTETGVDCSSGRNEEARPHHLALGEL